MGAQLRRQVHQADAEKAAIDQRSAAFIDLRFTILVDDDDPPRLDFFPLALPFVGADGARRSNPGREAESEATGEGVQSLSIAHFDFLLFVVIDRCDRFP